MDYFFRKFQVLGELYFFYDLILLNTIFNKQAIIKNIKNAEKFNVKYDKMDRKIN